MLTYVSPDRFTDKPMTLRALAESDYAVEIDSLTAGRILRTDRAGGEVGWLWVITGPYCGHARVQTSGTTADLEAAKAGLRVSFDSWLAWAATQPGPVTWLG